VPTILWRALSQHARLSRHRQVYPFTEIEQLRVRSLDERALPLQVDGDYIGDVDQAWFGVRPGGIVIIA
jgi:hypothetical protein